MGKHDNDNLKINKSSFNEFHLCILCCYVVLVKYRYFYAITSDVDDEISAGQIYKVDTWTGEVLNVKIGFT